MALARRRDLILLLPSVFFFGSAHNRFRANKPALKKERERDPSKVFQVKVRVADVRNVCVHERAPTLRASMPRPENRRCSIFPEAISLAHSRCVGRTQFSAYGRTQATQFRPGEKLLVFLMLCVRACRRFPRSKYSHNNEK